VVGSLVTGGGGNYNYFHWLFDVLPRLHILKLSGVYDGIGLFFVPSTDYAFQRESLACLGIGQDRIIASTAIRHIRARRLIATDHPSVTETIRGWACVFLRDAFLKHGRKPARAAARIYLSRKDSANERRIVNEDQLVAELEKMGFVALAATDFSFAEQVGLFAGAEMVVGAHGAGLANLVFCGAGTKVVEIFNPTYQRPMYAEVSQHCGLAYARVVGRACGRVAGQRADMAVDVGEILKGLKST
jgi:capsular polysaccharide biosynthesis protein